MRILFLIHDTAMFERMGVMYLSAALKKHGHEVKLLVSKRYSKEKLKTLVKGYSPAIVSYSAMTGEHKDLLELNKVLKKNLQFISVFGGAHATFFPQLINEEGVDAVCVGEADTVFAEFCQRYEYKEDYWKTPNFIIKRNGEIIHNPLSPLITNIDELPFPDRDIMYEAEPFLRDLGNKFFFSTRGCPYYCSYCFNIQYNNIYHGLGPVLRHRSALNIIDEICEVRSRYPLKSVQLLDDTFLLKPKGWFEEFSQLYKERVGLPLCCNVRANMVSREVIALLREAGLHLVWMGIECGNEEVSNTILKRNITNAQISYAARIIQKAGIKLVTQNLCGIPAKNSYQLDIQTLEFNFSIKPTFALTSVLYPYPGTPIETYARENNYLKGNKDYLRTNKYKSMLNFNSVLEKRRIENLHKLFDLFIRFSWLRPLRDLLCGLPLTEAYTMIFYLWYGYQMKFRLYLLPSGRNRLWSYARLFFNVLRNR